MRTLSISLIALLTGCLYCSASEAQVSYSKVKFESPASVQVIERPSASVTVMWAMRVHNLISQLKEYQKAREQLLDAQKRYELQQLPYKSMMLCNVNNLKPYFKNPQSAWLKILDKYDRDEKKLGIQINTTDAGASAVGSAVANTPGAAVSGNSDSDTVDLSETFLMWSLGNGILHDVYASQDNWGERIDRSFPLTVDQQYVYDEQDWYGKYKKINRAACCHDSCGIGYKGAPDTRETLKDGTVYDYHADYKYHENGKVKTAHDIYMAAIRAVHQKGCTKRLTPEMFTEPNQPPRPLPPVNETLIYDAETYSVDRPPFSEQRIYNGNQLSFSSGEWPAPWKTFIDSDFKIYNKDGAMPQNFKYASIVPIPLKDRNEAQLQAFYDSQNNRLNAYQILKKQLDDAQKILATAKVSYVENMQDLRSQVSDVNEAISGVNQNTTQFQVGVLTLPDNFTLLEQFDFDTVETDEDLDKTLDKILVKDKHVYYQETPDSDLKLWPDMFNILAGNTPAGNLVVEPDSEGIGRVYLKQTQTMPLRDFDLLTDEQIKEITDNFKQVKKDFIAKAVAELATELREEQTLSAEASAVKREGETELAETTDVKAQKSEFQQRLEQLIANLNISGTEGFVSSGFTNREVSETSEWPDIMTNTSKENLVTVLEALQEDEDAELFITTTNARRASDLKKSNDAVQSLIDTFNSKFVTDVNQFQSDWNKPFVKDDEIIKEIDAQCLNLGIYK